jgi:hypothetical protein
MGSDDAIASLRFAKRAAQRGVYPVSNAPSGSSCAGFHGYSPHREAARRTIGIIARCTPILSSAAEGLRMAVAVWEADRPKGRPPRWKFRVAADDAEFESSWVAVRFAARHDAEWLAGTIDRLAMVRRFAGCPGHPGQCPPVLWWGGDIGTDHGATVAGIHCHAEHVFGPVRGGGWYCQVHRDTEQFFHTAESGVQPRSGPAAWWVCEVVVGAVLAGVWQPSTPNPELQQSAVGI